MKKYLLVLVVIVAVIACNKTTTLPSYTPPVSKNLVVTTFAHTADTVNVGDTVYLTATGTIYDTLPVYGYFSVSSSSTGSPVYAVGSSSSPIKLSVVLGSQNVTATNPFTAAIVLPKITNVSGTKLTITGNFVYPLSLSSQGANVVTGVADAGQTTKTIYIQ